MIDLSADQLADKVRQDRKHYDDRYSAEANAALAELVRRYRQAVERADRLAAENERLREGIASALTSLATGPLKEGYAYAVLDALAADQEQA